MFLLICISGAIGCACVSHFSALWPEPKYRSVLKYGAASLAWILCVMSPLGEMFGPIGMIGDLCGSAGALYAGVKTFDAFNGHA